MFPFNSIFWLTILSSGCLIEARNFNFDVAPFSSVFSSLTYIPAPPRTCTADDPAVCGETYRNGQNGKRDRQTFQNQCEFDTYNDKFGDPFFKLKDGPCDSDDCPKCTNEERPVCYSVGAGFNNNRAFLNSCYRDRYLCLRGRDSLSIKMKDGRCEVCKEKRVTSNLQDAKQEDFSRADVQLMTVAHGCVLDTTSPLIAE